MESLHAVPDQPSPWVVRFAPLICGGEVLDLACGGGRHARFLAACGLHVLAVDRDTVALQSIAIRGISTLRLDMEAGDAAAWPFEENRFSGIVVTNYLHRPLFSKIFSSLAPNGVLIYETFARGNEQFGKPSNPDFLLKSGELLKLVQLQASMRVVAFEDGYVDQPKPAMIQRVCAVKAADHPDMRVFRLP